MKTPNCIRKGSESRRGGKRILFTAAGCIVVFIIVVIALYAASLSPVSSKEHAYSEKISVPSGSGIRSIADKLAEKKLIRSSFSFYIAARFSLLAGRKNSFTLKSGVYTVSSSMNVNEILDLLESGKQGYIKFVVPEGLTLSHIAANLETDGICSASSFKSSASSKALLEEYHVPGANFEGYLFPDTYFFVMDMDSEQIVRTMVDNFFLKIKDIPQMSNLSPQKLHDMIVLASIVEREYRVDSEAPLIASVFTNRIKEHVGLYSCATIEYIITEIEGKPHPDIITYDDLKIDSPYNTYKWAALPPGPISNPGMVALRAAANPPATNYYYFRLTDPQKGTHTFSQTFSSHKEAEHKLYTKKAASVK